MKAFEFSGTVLYVQADTGPGYGFRTVIKGVESSVTLDVEDYVEAIPDLTPGTHIHLSHESSGGSVVALRDMRGPVFYSSAGPQAPGGQGALPLVFEVSDQEVYYEEEATDTMCVRTVAHRRLRVKAGDETYIMAPGEQRMIEVDGRSFLAVAVDSRLVEESGCDGTGETHVSFFWMRLEQVEEQP